MNARDIIANQLDGTKSYREATAEAIVDALEREGWDLAGSASTPEAEALGAQFITAQDVLARHPVVQVADKERTHYVGDGCEPAHQPLPVLAPPPSADGEPPDGSVVSDPEIGVWVRGAHDPGLWAGRCAVGDVVVTAATWEQLCQLLGHPPQVVSRPPAAWDGPVLTSESTVDLAVQVRDEKDGPMRVEQQSLTIVSLERG